MERIQVPGWQHSCPARCFISPESILLQCQGGDGSTNAGFRAAMFQLKYISESSLYKPRVPDRSPRGSGLGSWGCKTRIYIFYKLLEES